MLAYVLKSDCLVLIGELSTRGVNMDMLHGYVSGVESHRSEQNCTDRRIGLTAFM